MDLAQIISSHYLSPFTHQSCLIVLSITQSSAIAQFFSWALFVSPNWSIWSHHVSHIFYCMNWHLPLDTVYVYYGNSRWARALQTPCRTIAVDGPLRGQWCMCLDRSLRWAVGYFVWAITTWSQPISHRNCRSADHGFGHKSDRTLNYIMIQYLQFEYMIPAREKCEYKNKTREPIRKIIVHRWIVECIAYK